jgi:hypothetical protein
LADGHLRREISAELRRSYSSGGVTVTESFLYDYVTSGSEPIDFTEMIEREILVDTTINHSIKAVNYCNIRVVRALRTRAHPAVPPCTGDFFGPKPRIGAKSRATGASLDCCPLQLPQQKAAERLNRQNLSERLLPFSGSRLSILNSLLK